MDKQEILGIWAKAHAVNGVNPNEWRKEDCGAWIKYDKYGDRNSNYGWEVDHIVPQSKLEEAGASQKEIDNPLNLRPLHWANNDSKSDDYPMFTKVVTAKDDNNVKIYSLDMIDDDLRDELNRLYLEYDF